MQINFRFDFRVNRVVKYFVLADLALIGGWGLLQPVFSVFVVEKVMGATLITVGVAAAIYWILKSILQIPIANFLDKRDGEGDDFKVLVIGLFIAALAAFSFLAVRQTWHLYLVEVVHAVAFALYVPSWLSIFSRHVDKERVSFDWALDNTVAGLAAGVSGFLGGVVAKLFGFPLVFILVGVLSMASAFILILAPELILPRRTVAEPMIKDHAPTDLGR